MSCPSHRPLLGPYLDRELDAKAASEVEAHLRDCAACRAELDELRALGDAARVRLERFAPSPGLEARLATSIQPRLPRRRTWLVAASAAVAAFAALLFLVLRPAGAPDTRLAEEIIDAHTRSLLVDHLTDVASSDQHTVKPWFNGKVPFGVPAADLAPAGFPLAGGRLDYVAGREVAALVYRRRSHVINTFVWPEPGDAAPRELGARGYTVLHFARAGLAWWLVSDASPAELRELARLLGAN